MKQLKSKYRDLRESFMNIKAKHIYEVFEAYPGNTDSTTLKKIMSVKDFDVMGVRENDTICGYVHQSELKNGPCSNYLKTFHISDLISESTPITSLVSLFKEKPRLFVLDTDKLTGIITRGDLQKTPVRMYLFALISLLEMHLQRIIQTRFTNDSWMIKLKEPRREKVREMYKERKQRNEDIGLIDCLQLCDKMTLIKKVDEVNDIMVKNNIANHSSYLSRIENIRNNVAHSQDLLTGTTWNKLFDTIEKLEKIIFILEPIELSGVEKNLKTHTT